MCHFVDIKKAVKQQSYFCLIFSVETDYCSHFKLFHHHPPRKSVVPIYF